MKRISKIAISILGVACAAPAFGCHGSVLDAVDVKPDDGSEFKKVQVTASKVDLLFVVDNSTSMGDKQDYLRQAVPAFVARLVHPSCVDAAGAVSGTADSTGACEHGKPEFHPVTDMHVGVISSSLGGRGSGACAMSDGNHFYPTHNDDRAHLLNRGGDDEHPVADAEHGNFLVWKADSSNPGGGGPLPKEIDSATQLASDVTDLIAGVHEHGCGFEAQLESMYRFLVQPDPYDTIGGGFNGSGVAASPPATLQGIDADLLAMRRAFLRPDSLVAVVLLTDENDSTVDPIAFGARAWEYEQANPVVSGTSACAAQPEVPECISCRLRAAQSDASCRDGEVQGGDALNVRFFHMKPRFGTDPQFPVSRYVRGLSQAMVPDRNGEHPVVAGIPSFDYVGDSTCTNPLFAAELPADPHADLCHLAPGPRRPESGLVYLTVIGGVPWQLLTTSPGDFSDGNTAPFKAKLDAADYVRMLGNDPLRYDFGGADAHMIESLDPRPGLGADDAHTREWNTKGQSLQLACTFDLTTPKDCDDPRFAAACDCDTATNAGTDSPVCDPAAPTHQTKGKAFPAIRELSVARGLGDQAIVGSICPRPGQGSLPTPGYLPVLNQLVDRASVSLVR